MKAFGNCFVKIETKMKLYERGQTVTGIVVHEALYHFQGF